MSVMQMVKKLWSSPDERHSIKDLGAGEHTDINDELIKEFYTNIQIVANPFTESEEHRVEAVRSLALNAYFGGPAMTILAGKHIPHIIDFMSEYERSAKAKVIILKSLSLLFIQKENRRIVDNYRDLPEVLASCFVNPQHPIIARWSCYVLCILCSDITLVRKFRDIPDMALALYPFAFDNIEWNGWRHNYAQRLFHLLGFDKKTVEDKKKAAEGYLLKDTRIIPTIKQPEGFVVKGLGRLATAGSSIAMYTRNAYRRMSNRPTTPPTERRFSVPTERQATPSVSIDKDLLHMKPSVGYVRRNTTGTAHSSALSIESTVSSIQAAIVAKHTKKYKKTTE